MTEFRQIETLEQRRVLAFDFVSAYVDSDTPFYIANVTTNAELTEAPAEIALRFTPGVEIDPATDSLGGISIVRSGSADDPFGAAGSFGDITYGFDDFGAILVDDFPSKNQVVIRFKETLPDDIYRITISSSINSDAGTDTITGLRTVPGQDLNGDVIPSEPFRGGGTFSFDVRLSLGQEVVSVVPQPIRRDPNDVTAGLTQARDQIEVYFDSSESLDQASAETRTHYRLIEVDDSTGADVGGTEQHPTSVSYDRESHKATLLFDPTDATDPAEIRDGRLYRLEIGGPGILAAPAAVVEAAGDHDSFAAAESLGAVDQSGVRVSGAIQPRAEIVMAGGELPSLYYPSQAGTFDEPGHREIPVDDSTHGLPEISVDAPLGTSQFNIDLNFGAGLNQAAITAAQTAAARWESVIIGDLSDQGAIDDISIDVYAGLLGSGTDGPSGTLANARPLQFRSGGDANPHLPFTAEVGIDMADVGSGQLVEILVHEIGHALGFTSASLSLNLIQNNGFVGGNAVREYLTLGFDPGANSVPIETDGGSGTAGAHWDEAEFNSELMTGYINPGVNPLSRLTVAAFDDMGYVVDYSQADPYLNLIPGQLAPSGTIYTVEYNFQSNYGSDPQGNILQNVITPQQKIRVREIFDIFSRSAGIRFVETASRGITVATGDTRVISDNSPTASVDGLARGNVQGGTVSGDALAVVNANRDWGESEYGGGFFREAMRQIGQVLGLWQSYDLPSVMGGSLPGENVFPSDYDILHLQQLYPPAGTEIDVYEFTLADSGQFRAETFAERLAAEASTLDTVLSVYNVSGALLARNDDSFGRDSRVDLDLVAGTYYVAVSSTGNTSFDLDVVHSGFGGLTQGDYELQLAHTPESTNLTTLVDASGTPLDGDRDGKAGGAFHFHFRTASAGDTIYVDKIATDGLATTVIAAEAASQLTLDDTAGIVAGMIVIGQDVPEGTTVLSNDSATQITLSAAVTLAEAVKLRFVTPGSGSLGNPFLTIGDALEAVTGTTKIIRVIGNNGSELEGASNASGRPGLLRPNALVETFDPYHYYIGYDASGNPLADGASLVVPAGVTLMVDSGATFRMGSANVDVGSSSELVSRAGAALQVLGVPKQKVQFTSLLKPAEENPGSVVSQAPSPSGGDWGGIVLRSDSDWQPAGSLGYGTLRPVLNSISNAVLSYGGGQVLVDAGYESFSPIQIEDTRPTVVRSTITYSAGAAISATPNSFEESHGRVGPQFRGNTLLFNSTNGVFLAIRTEFGSPLDKLDVSARFASTEVTYVLQESLVIAGGTGSYYEDVTGVVRARPSGRLQIDPGVVIKLQNSRIELERGTSRLFAEGRGNDRVIFTSFADNRFGAGGTFDTNGNLPDDPTPGDWGGVVLNAGAGASIAETYLTYGGGEVPLEGGLDDFNVIEVHQGSLRLVDSRIEANAAGEAETDRNFRGSNTAATIFVRGGQPIIFGNDFRDNAGDLITINANSLNNRLLGDTGRQVGLIGRYGTYDDNRGPLVRSNLISYESQAGDATAGLVVRAEEITVESVWDDTDIVHVVSEEIVVNNLHTFTGLRLESDADASLVVKLDGPNAGFTASGELLDIDDRVGGTVQVVGQPGYPVVLTSIADDTVGASVDLFGFPVNDTNVDGAGTSPQAGDWRSLQFLPLANDRNVAVINETESPYTNGQDGNNVVISSELLGVLAPNFADGTNTWESAQEKSGDESRRQGFEVHGSIAYDDAGDVDIYTFDGYAGSVVWIDIDNTSPALDTMVELLDASGRVLARSADSQTDTGSVAGVRVTAEAGGIAEVTGAETAVVASAAEVTGVGAVVVGETEAAAGSVTTATGVAALVEGIDQPALGAAVDVRGVAAVVVADSNTATVTINTGEFAGLLAGAKVFHNGVDVDRTVNAITGTSVALTGGNLNVSDGDILAFEIGGAPIAATRLWVSDNSLATNGGDLFIDGADSGVNVVSSGAHDIVVLSGQATLPNGSTNDVGLGFVGNISRQTDRVMVASTVGIADRVQVNGVAGLPAGTTRIAIGGVNAVRNTVTLDQAVRFTGNDRSLKFGYRAAQGAEVIRLDTIEFADATLGANDLVGQAVQLNGGNPGGVTVVSINNDMVTFTGDTVDVAHGDVLSFDFGAGPIDATRVRVDDAARATIGGSVHVEGVDSNETVVAGDAHAAANLAAASVVTLSGQATVDAAEDVAFGFNGVAISTDAIRVADTTGIVVGAPVNGLPGVPVGTEVANVDALTGTVVFDRTVVLDGGTLAFGFNGTTVSLDTTDLATPTNTIANGATVTRNGVVVPGISVDSIAGNVVTFIGTTNAFADGDEIGLFLDDAGQGAVTYDRLYLDDAALAVSLDAGAVVEYVGASADGATSMPAPASASGLVTLSGAVSVSNAELLVFGFVGGQPVDTSRVVVENNSDPLFGGVGVGVPVTMVAAGSADPRVPDGTTVSGAPVVTPEPTWSVVELSGPVTVADADDLGFGYNGLQVVLADVSGLNPGEGVRGPGVPDGTAIAGGGVDAVTSTITLTQSAAVADAATLTFSEQEFSILAAPEAAGLSILPGSLTGMIYDGDTAIQRFTAARDGTLSFTPIGNPPSRVTAGTVDYVSGGVSLVFDVAPRHAVSLEVNYDYSNVDLTTLGFEPITGQLGAYPLTKDAAKGGDYYTTNPRDAGMRVILPGTVGTGTALKYFVRVRSQPAVGADRATHESALVSPVVDAGQTTGSYELRIRTRQRDEKPGSTVAYADIRFPQIGIDVLGLPNNSPLVGTTGETEVDANDTLANAQQVGNLLTSDRNTISIAGTIATESDVDWYEFTISYEDIQSLLNHNNRDKTWATIFDIDYADGARGDLTLSVFDANGELIYVGRDSDIADDQPGAGQGNDADDLSRGSIGKLDPYIGSVQLPAGSTGTQTYFVAVSSNEQLPATLDQTFKANATNALARLEPISSLNRVAHDTIGGTGYTSDGVWQDAPGLINLGNPSEENGSIPLSANVRPFTLADVTLFVSTGGSLYTIDPFTGQRESLIEVYGSGGMADLDMRTDGTLMTYVDYGDGANLGTLQTVNPADGVRTTFGGDGIKDDAGGSPPPADNVWAITGSTPDAVAIRRTNIATYTVPGNFGAGSSPIVYSVRDSAGVTGTQSFIYGADNNGSAAMSTASPQAHLRGRMGYVPTGVALDTLYPANNNDAGTTITGFTTGLQYRNETGALYGVSQGGQFYRITQRNAVNSAAVYNSPLVISDARDFSGLLGGSQLAGLATAPVNLEGGRYQGMFFAITTQGELVCIDPDGNGPGDAALVDNVFDTDGDGIADSHISSPAGVGGVTGLAFSPLDTNLWHPTNRRGTDDGHGVHSTPDNTRQGNTLGGTSMRFGLEEFGTVNTYLSYDGQAGQYGVVGGNAYNWQQDLTAGTGDPNFGAIGNNYNLPGGAHGSLQTNSFSLVGYTATDKPTLYFNYFLETEGQDSTASSNSMRDSARVVASRDGGLTWELLATNNSIRSGADGVSPRGELPPVLSASTQIGNSRQYGNSGPRLQQVQELFDNTGSWRQARVDLADFAGESSVLLRFDFSTAGELDANDNATIEPEALREVTSPIANLGGGFYELAVDSVVGLQVGMLAMRTPDVNQQTLAVVGGVTETPEGPATVVAIDADTNTVLLLGYTTDFLTFDDVTYTAGEMLSFFAEDAPKNNILGLAGTVGNFVNVSDANSGSRSLSNDHEGFYVDDIIIGFAERGEMVTYDGGATTVTTFFDIGTPTNTVDYPQQTLSGEYQLEIRRGTEFASLPRATASSDWHADRSAEIYQRFDTNDRLVEKIADAPVVLQSANFLNADIGNLDPAEVVGRGNGNVTPLVGAGGSATAVALSADSTTNLTSHTVADWHVDLEGQPTAVLRYGLRSINHADEFSNETYTPLPATFRYVPADSYVPGNARASLPSGDGVAIDLLGDGNWITVDQFGVFGNSGDFTSRSAPDTGSQGERWVDLVAKVQDADPTIQPDPTTGSIFTDQTRIGFFHTGSRRDGGTVDGTYLYTGGVVVSGVEVLASRPIETTGTIGDSNNVHEFEQGQFVVQGNIISDAESYGIRIDAGRDVDSDPDNNYSGPTNAPHLGVARMLPVINNAGLVPGAVVTNNLIVGSQTAGILFSGSANTQSQPVSVVPYGRIINNTIYGGGTAAGATGIVIEEAAGPTLLNNVFAELAVGVEVDPSSELDALGRKRTVINTSAFYNIGAGNEVVGASQTQSVIMASDPFVNAANRNFYPAQNSEAGGSNAIVDSSLNSLQDRNAYTVVTEAVGIAPSPIVTLPTDLFGQLRQDDPDQASLPGLGLNAFKDRGAIERVDRSPPSATLVLPLDQNNSQPFQDDNPAVDAVELRGTDARSLRQFVIQLEDVGVGIDKASVVPEVVTLKRDGDDLNQNVDYFFQYNANTNQIVLASTVVFPLGEYIIELRADADQSRLVDLAGNPLRANALDGSDYYTSFAISLDDAPTAPAQLKGQAGDGSVTLEWALPNTAKDSPVTGYVVEYSTDGGGSWVDWTAATSTTVDASPAEVTGLDNNDQHLFRITARNKVGLSPVSEVILAKPSAPQNVVGVAGQEEVTLSWLPPVNTGLGSGSVNDYVIDKSIDNGETWVNVVDGDITELTATSVTVSNLVKNTPYTFRVAGRTSAGQGASGHLTSPVTPTGVPDAPTDLLAEIDVTDGSVKLEWQPPDNDGGIPVTEYRVTYDDSVTTATVSVSAGLTELDVDGLNRGTEYTFRIVAVNTHGESEMSAEAVITTPDILADAPVISRATAGLDSVMLYWSAVNVPAGDVNLIDYVVQMSFDGETGWVIVDDGIGPATSGEVMLLNRDDGDHYFRVAAKNALPGVDPNDLTYSDAFGPVVPLARSGAVEGLAGAPGDEQVALSWSTPSDNGGSGVFDYAIEYSDDNGITWQEFDDGVSAATTVVVDGLTNGVAYDFRVAAVTAAGAGVKTTLNAQMPFGPPTAVTQLAAEAGDERVTLTWEHPANIGGQPLSGYRVEYSTSETGPWNVHNDPAPADLTATVAGLEKQVPYFFRVTAINAGFEGDAATIGPIEPLGRPDAATDLTFAYDQTDGSLLVGWAEPENTGSLPVTYLTEYRLAGSNGAWQSVNEPVQTDTQTDIAGLSRGLDYEVRVRAENSLGFSPDLIGTTTAADVPVAPTNLTAIATPGVIGSISLSWTPPVIAGGELQIIDYIIEESLDDGQTWSTVVDGVGTTPSYTFGGRDRTAGEHRYRVAARNVIPGVVAEDLNFSSVVGVRPLGLSEAVGDLLPVPGDQSVALSWTAPADTGGVSLSGYRVEVNDGSGWTAYGSASSTLPTRTLTGLVNGNSYTFRVTPRTALGDGTAVTTGPVVPYGVPAAPTNLIGFGGYEQVTLSWSAGSDNGESIDDYVIEYATSQSGPWTVIQDGVSTTEATVLTGLPTGVDLFFRVAAENDGGQGNFSNIAGPFMANSTPAAPTGLVAVANPDGAIGLSWDPPNNNGGEPVLGYRVEWRRTEGTVWNLLSGDLTTDTTRVVTDLPRAYGPYTFRVQAVSILGQGQASEVSNSVLPLAAPSRVLDLSVDAGDQKLVLSWSAPADDGGASVTDYVIQYSSNNGGSWSTVNDGLGTGTSHTITGLTNGTAYVVRIFAGNSVRYGAPEQSGVVTPLSPPAAPSGLTLTVNSGAASLVWNPPSDTGGVPILDYIVQYRIDGLQESWTTWPDGTSTTPATLVTGLTNDTLYKFRVAAETAMGVGEFLESESTLIGPRVASPSRFSGAVEAGRVRLRWVAPLAPPNYPILDYRIEYRANGQGAWSLATDEPSSEASTDLVAYVTGLDAGTSYQFRIAAVTAIGVGNYALYEPLLTPTQG